MGKYNVFCIDDDYPTNVYNEIILSESELFESYRIFDDGMEALTALKDPENSPDVILIDVNMPKIDGWSFVEALRKNHSENDNKSYVIFMLTTSSSPIDEAKSKEYPWVKGIMEKPLTDQKLQMVLNKVQPR